VAEAAWATHEPAHSCHHPPGRCRLGYPQLHRQAAQAPGAEAALAFTLGVLATAPASSLVKSRFLLSSLRTSPTPPLREASGEAECTSACAIGSAVSSSASSSVALASSSAFAHLLLERHQVALRIVSCRLHVLPDRIALWLTAWLAVRRSRDRAPPST